MLRRSPLFICAVLVGLFLSRPAAADVQFEEHGSVVFMASLRLEVGDELAFAEFIAKPRERPIRIIYLNSLGGNTGTAMAIGHLIRANRLDTAFHVGQGRCVSACTTIFVAGVQRYYINSEGVPDGIATHLGLGFHPSNGGDETENRINEYYRDMGVPRAAQLRYHIYSRDQIVEPTHEHNTLRMFFVGARSALEAGVATSTSEPADAKLRDLGYSVDDSSQ